MSARPITRTIRDRLRQASQFIDGRAIGPTAHVRAAAEPWAERPVRHGLVTLASHEQSSSLQPATDGLAAEHRQSTAS